jgi:hypothetical protein
VCNDDGSADTEKQAEHDAKNHECIPSWDNE